LPPPDGGGGALEGGGGALRPLLPGGGGGAVRGMVAVEAFLGGGGTLLDIGGPLTQDGGRGIRIRYHKYTDSPILTPSLEERIEE